MIRTPLKKADDKHMASVDTADKTADELGKASKDDKPAAVEKEGGQSFLGLLQQKQQAASGTYFSDKTQGVAHDVGAADDDGDATPGPAHKKPKVGAGTEGQPKAQPKAQRQAQPKAQPKAAEEQQPKRKKAKR